MKILLLCHYQTDNAETIVDHIHAIEKWSGHDVFRLSLLGDLPDGLDLSAFDAVLIHYSTIISFDTYLSPFARMRLRRFQGPIGVFIQDEYRWVDSTISALRYLRADLLFTCVPQGEIEKVYSKERLPNLSTVNVLTGYVPDRLLGRSVPSYGEREWEVGYRGRRLSASLGMLGREKWEIAERFQRTAAEFSLRSNISSREEDRFYGNDWTHFIASCRSMLGVESGASVFDFSGEIAPAVEREETRNPSRDFDSLEREFFPGLDGLIKLNQISPRCFECASLRTMMILYEGSYSNILIPWRHYVPLKKDFSNEREIVDALRNRNVWSELTEYAYSEIAMDPSYGYRAFGERVGTALMEVSVALQSNPVPFLAKRNDAEEALELYRHQETDHGLPSGKGRVVSVLRNIKLLVKAVRDQLDELREQEMAKVAGSMVVSKEPKESKDSLRRTLRDAYLHKIKTRLPRRLASIVTWVLVFILRNTMDRIIRKASRVVRKYKESKLRKHGVAFANLFRLRNWIARRMLELYFPVSPFYSPFFKYSNISSRRIMAVVSRLGFKAIGQLENETALLLRLQSYGRTSLEETGRFEFRLNYIPERHHLFIQFDDLEGVTNREDKLARSGFLNNLNSGKECEIFLLLEDQCGEGEAISGISNIHLPGLSRLTRIDSEMAAIILLGGDGQESWGRV